VAVTVEAVNSQTATLTTEHTLSGAAITGAKSLVLTVNTKNLVNGETVWIRAYSKVETGDATPPDATLLVYSAIYKHIQGQPVKVSPPIPSAYSTAFTLRQDGGTGRAFQFRIDSL
jgi:hypothetical protein